MLLLEDGHDHIVGVDATLRDRIAAHLHADSIDDALAHGAAPDANAATSLRAAALTSTRSRRGLAEGLERVVAEAAHPTPTSLMRVPLNRSAVLSASSEIDELRQRLLRPGPVSARGVAQTRVLLTSGGGPLRGRGAADDLGRLLRDATQALDVLARRLRLSFRTDRGSVAQPKSAESSRIVTGPSLTRLTAMSAPNTPVSTWAPSRRSAST